jgi:hypothetical protein
MVSRSDGERAPGSRGSCGAPHGRGRTYSLERIAEVLGSMSAIPVPIPADCADGFEAAYWRRPTPSSARRSGTPPQALSFISDTERASGTANLSADQRSGDWERRCGHLLALRESRRHPVFVQSTGGQSVQDRQITPPFQEFAMDTASFPRRVPGGLLRLSGLVAGGLGLVVAVAAAAAPPVPHESSTSPAGGLLSVSAVSETDVWSVGDGDREPLMLRWNGTAWARTALSGKGLPGLNAVSADSADDAWAVGAINGPHGAIDDLAMHWNGTAWTKVAIPSPGKGSPIVDILNGVSALSPSDAWAVGLEDLPGGNLVALALHWNGTAWTQVAIPHPIRGGELFAVTALSASDVWAFGDSLILHWDGTAWTKVTSPLGSETVFGASALSPGDIWAAGYTGFGTSLVLHWNGTAWTPQPSPNPGGSGRDDFSRLFGVSALSDTNAWAVGNYGHLTANGSVSKPLILHWNGTSWTQTASPSFSRSADLNSVVTLSPADAWAVGGTRCGRCIGNAIILHWNGTSWTRA